MEVIILTVLVTIMTLTLIGNCVFFIFLTKAFKEHKATSERLGSLLEAVAGTLNDAATVIEFKKQSIGLGGTGNDSNQ